MDQIFGVVEKINFQNTDNGFTVAKLKEPRKTHLTTIVGTLPALKPGENVRCLGNWKNNSSHGMQFEVKECHLEAPCDIEGIKKYLSSGLIHGIGPAYAERIIKKFGLKTLDIIDQSPLELLDVPGIGEKRVEKIAQCWQAQKAIRQLMFFLQNYGISPSSASKIYRQYGESSIEKLKENPYQLATDISGIGFKKADQMAEKLGFKKEGFQRIDSGVLFVLDELASQGHVCFPRDEFLIQCQEILEVEPSLIKDRLESLKAEDKIVEKNLEERSYLWSKLLYLCEKGIAREISRLQNHTNSIREIDQDKAIIWVQNQLNIELAENQKKAVLDVFKNKLLIITGGPGTGKSTITKAILKICEKLTPRIILAAPTGRAAKRMQEITGKMAHTIHSLLQFDFQNGGFKKNKDNPLESDLIIVDESSMIDTYLMYSLLKAIPNHSKVIFVGDIHQLPSVGPGNVLKEIIDSEKVKTTFLTEIFRQAAGSKIITNAHKINQGVFPDLKNEAKSDFYFVKAEESEEVISQILHLVSDRLPKFNRFHPINDIQVLSPMKRGPLGTESLNYLLQKKLNKNTQTIQHGNHFFSLGDKVMQIRNNYQKEVYNGDIGKIIEIQQEEQELTVVFDEKFVTYQFQELEEIVLAYATSIHKYQGSECACVVIPIHTSHFIMLHRNLLYTGITRGKKMVVLVGTGKAIAIATSNNEMLKRYTCLKLFIKEIEEKCL